MKKGSGHFLWAVGGKVELTGALNDVSVYSVKDNYWYSSSNGDLSPMPHPVHGAGWTFYNNKIYCFGGKTNFHSGISKLIQVYDIAKDKWSLLSSMPMARSKLSKFYPVVDGHYIYLFGGDCALGQYVRVNWNWKFDLEKETWDLSVADAPLAQSFPISTYHNGWLYYTTGNINNGPYNRYPGGINQRYSPKKNVWEVLEPGPVPITDGEGDKYNDELHLLGGWNPNPIFYNILRPYFKGGVRKLHLVYNYDSGSWRFEKKLPGKWHHGGCRATKDYLWRYLGTVDEEVGLKTKILRFVRIKNPRNAQHTNNIFRWKGNSWEKMAPAPIRKMNFGSIYTNLGPIIS